MNESPAAVAPRTRTAQAHARTAPDRASIERRGRPSTTSAYVRASKRALISGTVSRVFLRPDSPILDPFRPLVPFAVVGGGAGALSEDLAGGSVFRMSHGPCAPWPRPSSGLLCFVSVALIALLRWLTLVVCGQSGQRAPGRARRSKLGSRCAICVRQCFTKNAQPGVPGVVTGSGAR